MVAHVKDAVVQVYDYYEPSEFETVMMLLKSAFSCVEKVKNH